MMARVLLVRRSGGMERGWVKVKIVWMSSGGRWSRGVLGDGRRCGGVMGLRLGMLWLIGDVDKLGEGMVCGDVYFDEDIP